MYRSKLNYIDDVISDVRSSVISLYDITDVNDIYHGDCDDDNDGYNIYI